MNPSYDREIGYSPLECVDQRKLRALVQVVKRIIAPYYRPREGDRLLVAGAGRGDEAIVLHEALRLATVAVDLHLDSAMALSAPRQLAFQRQDLHHLGFMDDCFALVYSYHVLEHVGNPKRVLRELHRVLKPGGTLFIGFPNRHRLVSYIGTSQRASVVEKLRWNLSDYGYRLRGKFDNVHGAHAGFTQGEFLADAGAIFPVVHPVREEYMAQKYRRLSSVMRTLSRVGLGEVIFPSNYFVCLKGAG